jgi:N-methylhydantoinase B/oxoprolinase/acetone carboxylase alpha subunit
MTVNQTIRQTRKVIAYFRHSMVQKWGQGHSKASQCYPNYARKTIEPENVGSLDYTNLSSKELFRLARQGGANFFL